MSHWNRTMLTSTIMSQNRIFGKFSDLRKLIVALHVFEFRLITDDSEENWGSPILDSCTLCLTITFSDLHLIFFAVQGFSVPYALVFHLVRTLWIWRRKSSGITDLFKYSVLLLIALKKCSVNSRFSDIIGNQSLGSDILYRKILKLARKNLWTVDLGRFDSFSKLRIDLTGLLTTCISIGLRSLILVVGTSD